MSFPEQWRWYNWRAGITFAETNAAIWRENKPVILLVSQEYILVSQVGGNGSIRFSKFWILLQLDSS